MIRNRLSRMNKFRKRAFAAALATAVVSTSLNIGSIAASAGTSARGRVIVAFDELPEDVADQTLPIGGKKSDINFPDELNVLLYSEDADREEQEDEEPRDPTDIREQEDETPSDNSPEEPSDVSEQESTDDTDPEDVKDNDSTDTDSSQDEASGETTEEIPSVEDERIVEDESRDDGSDAADGSDGNTVDGGDEESDTGGETESDDSTGEPDADGSDGASAKLIDTAVNGIRNMAAPVRAYAAEVDSDGADNTDADDNTGEGDSDSSEDDGGLRRLADGERRTLEDVRWKLIKNKSEYGSRFQAVREGDVFYFAPDISAYGLKSDADLPEIRVTIVAEDGSVSDNEVSENEVSENEVSENSISENSVSENEIAAFDQFMIVGGVKVAVTAPEGVFPKDAVLKVKKVDDAASNEKIEQTLKEDMGLSDATEINGEASDRSDDDNTEGSSTSETLNYITFDITITDVSGNEIQPDTEYGNAEVTFSQVDIISDYLDAPGKETEGKLNEADSDEEAAGKKTLRVYHFEDGLENGQKLDSSLDEAESSLSVSADHFSEYTIAYSASSEIDIKVKINVMNHTYEILQPNEETEEYTNSTKEIEITAEGDSVVDKLEYMITDEFYSSENALKALDDSKWSTYNDKARPDLRKNMQNFIYVKVTDDGGGVTIILSKGIWEDEMAPVISKAVAEMNGTSAGVTVTASDGESGLAAYYVLAKKEGETAPSASDIKSSGQKNTTGEFTLTDLSKGASYVFYAVTEDKAGNLSGIKTASGTVAADPPTVTIGVSKFSYSELQGKDGVEDYYANTPQSIRLSHKGDSEHTDKTGRRQRRSRRSRCGIQV